MCLLSGQRKSVYLTRGGEIYERRIKKKQSTEGDYLESILLLSGQRPSCTASKWRKDSGFPKPRWIKPWNYFAKKITFMKTASISIWPKRAKFTLPPSMKNTHPPRFSHPIRRFPRGSGNGRLQNGAPRRRRNFRDDEKMRRKKIIAFCRRLLVGLQRAKNGTEKIQFRLFILGYFRRRKPLREILTPTEPAGKTDPTSTSSLSGSLK